MIDSTKLLKDKIYTIHGQKVMLDSDLAELYGVETFNLNKAVKRNIGRFPNDFMFQVTKEELNLLFQNGITSLDNLRSQFMTSSSGYGGRRYLPYAFTEQGVAMRKELLSDQNFHKRLDELEDKLATHDDHFKVVFTAIKKLMSEPESTDDKKIGFRIDNKLTQ